MFRLQRSVKAEATHTVISWAFSAFLHVSLLCLFLDISSLATQHFNIVLLLLLLLLLLVGADALYCGVFILTTHCTVAAMFIVDILHYFLWILQSLFSLYSFFCIPRSFSIFICHFWAMTTATRKKMEISQMC